MARESNPNRALRRQLQSKEQLQPAQVEEVQSMSITREVTHVGPIPSPAALAEYEKALPGLADRVVKMAEDESLHRRELEKQIVQAQVEDGRAARNDQKLGQKSGLSIAILVVLCGFGAICLGHPVSGTVLAGGSLVSLVGVFVYGRERMIAELKESSEPHRKLPTAGGKTD